MKKKTPQGLSDKADMLALIDDKVKRLSAVDYDETK